MSETPVIAVGVNTPPVPLKLAERIWRKEFIDLSELLPAPLGTPELTLMDLIAKQDKVKKSKKDPHHRAVGGLLQHLHQCDVDPLPRTGD